MSVCSFPGMVLSHHQGSCSPRDTKRLSCTRRVSGVWFSDQLRGLCKSLWLQGGLKNEPPKEVPSLVKHALHILSTVSYERSSRKLSSCYCR